MKKINYLELGGTLFIPATHKNLKAIVSGEKYQNLRSILVDTEDGISKESLTDSLEIIKNLLKEYKKKDLFVFIRPRNPEVLKELLAFENIENIDGFILPKFSLLNAEEYLNLLKGTHFSIMPSIEGRELFNQAELHKLKDILLTNADKIALVRYGLEDMLRQLSMRRSCEDSIFDFSATASVLGTFIAIFKSAGFGVSGGVYPCFSDKEGFVKDVKRDMKEGLFSKTIIHPSQIDAVNELYKVTQKEFDEALEICRRSEAIFSQDTKMAEPITMRPYSQNIVLRAEIYGIKEEV